MAIVQISKITHRKGLDENLPQLSGAELGWSVDAQQLYIGNGTLEEGAPVIGNTEILTEFSDILAYNTIYTYKGDVAGYTVQTGPVPGSPVTQSLQSRLDSYAIVTDFGAVGDGITDDTAAINRALYQIYCREINPQIRRALFFPAGIYRVQETIIIPPYATLYGEGANNSIIQLDVTSGDSTLNFYVARTGDSLQQTGVNIGNNGAIFPQYINISDMGFSSLDDSPDIFLIDRAANCKFQSVKFEGPFVQADLDTDLDDVAGIRFDSTPSLVCNQISFDDCIFKGTTYAINTDEQIRGITVSKSQFDTLYQGILLGTDTPILGGPTGFRIVHNMFDNIYDKGIFIGPVSLNISGYNIFYDVANNFGGTTSPAAPVIEFENADNISIGDMFQRSDEYVSTFKRIELNNTASIAITNGSQIEVGTYNRYSGILFTLVNNTSSATTINTISITKYQAWAIDYTIVRDTAVRTGKFIITAADADDSSLTLSFNDDYTENTSTGTTLTATQVGDNISWKYTTSSTGVNGSLSYSITHLQ